MSQLHKRFSDQEVAFLLQSYSQGLLNRREIQERLSISKTRFFELLKMYQADYADIGSKVGAMIIENMDFWLANR